jgi:hypothetical protein
MSARPCGHRWDTGLPFAAHQYADLGYAVLPLAPGSKKPHPMVADAAEELMAGVHYASADHRQIAQWWTADPLANIGVATGEASQLVVVDLDTKHDDGRARFWQLLTERQLGMSWTASAQTPSGGWHVWLRMHSGMEVSRERRGILPGVDVKGRGGYVVAAPSALVMEDKAGTYSIRYSWNGWSCACAAPLAPGWMADWLLHALASGSSGSGDLGPVPDLSEAAAKGFETGRRNNSFYLAACSMYARRWPDDAVIRQLRMIWEKTDQTGMRWHEVTTAAASAKAFIERDRVDEETRTGMLAAWARRQGV